MKKPFKRRLKTVLKSKSQIELGKELGISNGRISQIMQLYPDAWVLYDDDGLPWNIEWIKICTLRKAKNEPLSRL